MNNDKTIEVSPHIAKYAQIIPDYVFGIITEGLNKGFGFKKYYDGRIEEVEFDKLPEELKKLYKEYERT